jgi:hypothetical protein
MLDIVPFEALNNDSSWKNISDDVTKEMAGIWKSEYGEDWRDLLISQSHQWGVEDGIPTLHGFPHQL